jgi:hypothetical protein
VGENTVTTVALAGTTTSATLPLLATTTQMTVTRTRRLTSPVLVGKEEEKLTTARSAQVIILSHVKL